MQRINFYSADLLPQRERVDFRQTMLIVPVFILLLVLIAFYQRSLLQQERLNTQAARDNLKTVLNQISQMSAQHTPTTRPIDIEALRQHLTQQKNLLASLAKQNWSDRGFSSLLTTLSEQAEPHIWLTTIAINNQSLQLQGATLNPEKIPDWLARLQQQSALSDVKFAQLKLLREENKPILKFEVKSSDAISTAGVAP